MPNHTSHTCPKLHWIDLAVSTAPALAVGFVLHHMDMGAMFRLALIIAALPAPANALIAYCTTRVTLYPNKLEYASGFFYRASMDLPIARIESVRMAQTLLGRILGYGRVTVTAIGSSPITTPNLVAPKVFREQLLKAMDRASIRDV